MVVYDSICHIHGTTTHTGSLVFGGKNRGREIFCQAYETSYNEEIGIQFTAGFNSL